ncbi:MAG: enoyl-CoA hydratase [Pseudomonadota bacterium]
MSAELLASRRDATMILTLSNPGARNALHPDIYAALIETLSTAERDDSLRAIVLTGADNFFCAGGNLNRLLENRVQDKSVQADSLDRLHACVSAIRDCPKPVIAAVEGAAAGAGFSLALACDMMVAGESAKFVMAYVKVGLTPDGGGSWFLAQALPRQLATEILLEGKPIQAPRLHALGIVNRLVPDGAALDNALAWADDLAQLSPNAAERIKALMREAQGSPLAQHLEFEKHHFVESLHHRDGQEGISAFLEKRKPNYS